MNRLSTKRAKSKMRDYPQQARRAGAKRDEATAEETVKIARKLCPVSDNNEAGHVHLRDTIRVEKDRRTGSASAVAGDEERGVFHAQFVEEGTTHADARPYMRPAAKAALKRTNGQRIRLYRG